MKKESLKSHIAQTAYNVGYGAKKHFATYDIVEKIPGWIGFISMAVGIGGLIYQPLTVAWISVVLTIVGIASLYINFHTPTNGENMKAGEALTALFHRLRLLYDDVDATNDANELAQHRATLEQIQSQALAVGRGKQIFGSDWYAHFKLFGQSQTQWFETELGLKFWRDKMPRSLLVLLVILLILAAACVVPCIHWSLS